MTTGDYSNIGYALWAKNDTATIAIKSAPPSTRHTGVITYIDSDSGATYIRPTTFEGRAVSSGYVIDASVGSKVEFDISHDEEGTPYAVGVRLI